MFSSVHYQTNHFGLLVVILILGGQLIAAQTCGAGCGVPGCETCADFGVVGSINWCKCCTYDCGGARSSCISQYQFCTGSSGRCFDVAGSCFSTPASFTRTTTADTTTAPTTTIVVESTAAAESAIVATGSLTEVRATALGGSTADEKTAGTSSSVSRSSPFVDSDGAVALFSCRVCISIAVVVSISSMCTSC
jgi:hypothetical protein